MLQTPDIGAEIAGYRIERLIGRGGMGVVYLAQHIRLGRHAALKLLNPALEDAQFRDRFSKESQLAASLDHPNIIPVYDAGEAEGYLYIAMRYVDGVDLGGLLKQEGPLDPARTLSIIEQVGSALDAAHAEGLVHRDVKPGNILIVPRKTPDGHDHVYLADFGLTKHQGSTSGLTRTGQFMGTIDYIAPEQIEGKDVDGRADLYSLACVAYQCLTDTLPFERDNEVAAMYAHLRDAPPSLDAARPDLPAALGAVLTKGMAKSPDERYSTCEEMSVAFGSALEEGDQVTRAASRPAPTDEAGAETTAAAIPAPLVVPDTPAQPSVESSDEDESPASKSKPKSKSTAFALGGLVVAVVVLVAAIFFALNGGNAKHRPGPDENPPTVPTTTDNTLAPEASGALDGYISDVNGVLAQSTQARNTINDALVDAASSDKNRREQAPGEIQTAIDQRNAQIRILKKLKVPDGAEKANKLLIEALAAAVESDKLYLNSVEAGNAGNSAAEQSNQAAAVHNDAVTVQPLKKSFIRAYNELLKAVGQPELSHTPMF